MINKVFDRRDENKLRKSSDLDLKSPKIKKELYGDDYFEFFDYGKVNSKNSLEEKTKYKRKWKPYTYLSYAEKKKLMEKETLKDKIKNEYHPNTKFFKNLDYDKKSLGIIEKPNTPHNTGQFLTHNFAQIRNQQMKTKTNCEINVEDKMEGDEYINDIDNLCIPGGSMREVLEAEHDDYPNGERKRFLSYDSLGEELEVMRSRSREESFLRMFLNKDDVNPYSSSPQKNGQMKNE